MLVDLMRDKAKAMPVAGDAAAVTALLVERLTTCTAMEWFDDIIGAGVPCGPTNTVGGGACRRPWTSTVRRPGAGWQPAVGPNEQEGSA